MLSAPYRSLIIACVTGCLDAREELTLHRGKCPSFESLGVIFFFFKRQEEKGTTGDEVLRWHHWFNGHESEQAPGAEDGQGNLGSCSPWSLNESDMTKQLN